jgi:hypothetical protein
MGRAGGKECAVSFMTYRLYVREEFGDRAVLQHESKYYDDDFEEAVRHFAAVNYKVGVIDDDGVVVFRTINLTYASGEEKDAYRKFATRFSHASVSPESNEAYATAAD